ncbi:MAG: Uncharacterized conserved protein, LabA/DUF88 family [Chloroflexi bacterium]|jgi:uncharacterized LabA/DUF88 family protein|nr:MAG: Uncharacterized conserved protein, LabA/DUF88 family [Chloroflexota bacterium]|tara:strand:- start:8235 stop:9053 length:819 start_codon:yes stop_codon:yes gene_type:complete
MPDSNNDNKKNEGNSIPDRKKATENVKLVKDIKVNEVTKNKISKDAKIKNIDANNKKNKSTKVSSEKIPAVVKNTASSNSQTDEKSGINLSVLSKEIAELKKTLDASIIKQKIGIFVDVPNLLYGVDADDDSEMDMGRLLDLLKKDRELIRATAYSPIVDDSDEPLQEQRFVKPFVPFDYRIVTKPMKRFSDGSVKGNLDIELVVDMITMCERLDVITLISGDADFLKAIQYVQSKGIKVEVASFPKSTSVELRAVADEYLDLSKLHSKFKL